jgi:hypothetical protein
MKMMYPIYRIVIAGLLTMALLLNIYPAVQAQVVSSIKSMGVQSLKLEQLNVVAISDQKVSVEWKAAEYGNTGIFYEIERSTDNIHFRTIAVMLPEENLKNGLSNYKWKDDLRQTNNRGYLIYRLKLVDNRKVYDSKMITVQLPGSYSTIKAN